MNPKIDYRRVGAICNVSRDVVAGGWFAAYAGAVSAGKDNVAAAKAADEGVAAFSRRFDFEPESGEVVPLGLAENG